MLKRKSFTLIELLVVITIIGVLGVLSFSGFGGSREGALDKDAKANLAFIQEGEKFYKMESGSYYPSSGNTSVIADINTNLRISLPTDTLSWSYNVDKNNTRATASRLPSSSRVWTLNFTGNAATCTGTACY